MPTLKKIAAISFLLVLLISTVGISIKYSSLRQVCRNRMREYLLHNEYTEGQWLVFEKNSLGEPDVNWEEDGKEFFYKSELYDVLSICKQDGKFFIHCVTDKQEEQLIYYFMKPTGTSKEKISVPKQLQLYYEVQQGNFSGAILPATSTAPFYNNELLKTYLPVRLLPPDHCLLLV